MPAVMRTTSGRPVRLARWWLVAALLIGVALMHGGQCRDGMAAMGAAMPSAGAHVGTGIGPAQASTDEAVTEHIADPAGPAGAVVGACLALLVGALGTLLLLDRNAGRRLVAAVGGPAGPWWRSPVRVRALALAQLCLLRT